MLQIIDIPSIIIGAVVGGIIIYLVVSTQKDMSILSHRRDAVKKSKSVVAGQVYEQIAPLLHNFPYHPKDMVFIGKGIDYLVFDGLHKGHVKQIIAVEIKTGKSQLNKNESMIKHTIQRGKVYYEIIRL